MSGERRSLPAVGEAAAPVRATSLRGTLGVPAMTRRHVGKPIEGFDALIAATALGAGASVATRDTAGFSDCGLTLIDPWTTE